MVEPGDEEAWTNANLNEFSVALGTLQVMAVDLSALEAAMSKALGFDITQAVPLANGDNAWRYDQSKARW